MAETVGKLEAILSMDSRGFTQGIKAAQGQLSQLGKNVQSNETGFQKLWKNMNAFKALGAAIVAKKLFDFGAAAVSAASDVEESINAVNVVFGEAADTILDFAADSTDAVFETQSAINQMATVTGSLLQNFGYDARAAADATVMLTQRAADMASVFNTSVEEALTAINAALRGETEPIRRFGVSVDEAQTKVYALANGLWDGTGAMDMNAKVAARLGLIMDQTAKVQGDAANTADSFANQQRRLNEQWNAAQVAIGEKLLPVLNDLMPVLIDMIPRIGDLAASLVGILKPALDVVVDVLGPVSDILGEIGGAIDDISGSAEGVSLGSFESALEAIAATGAPAVLADIDGKARSVALTMLDAAVTGRDFEDAISSMRDEAGFTSLEIAQGIDWLEEWRSELFRADAQMYVSVSRLNDMRDAFKEAGQAAGEYRPGDMAAPQGSYADMVAEYRAEVERTEEEQARFVYLQDRANWILAQSTPVFSDAVTQVRNLKDGVRGLNAQDLKAWLEGANPELGRFVAKLAATQTAVETDWFMGEIDTSNLTAFGLDVGAAIDQIKTGVYDDGKVVGADIIKGIQDALAEGRQPVVSDLKALGDAMVTEAKIDVALGKAARLGLRKVGDVFNESGNRDYVLRSVTNLTTDIQTYFDMYGALYGKGQTAMQGLIDGLKSMLTKGNTEAIRWAGKAVQELWLQSFATKVTVTVTANKDGSFNIIPKPGEIVRGQFGAPATAGVPMIVGEGGKELFVPKQDGEILPMWKTREGGGSAPVINVNVGGSVVTERDLVDVVMEGMLRAQRHGMRVGA